MKRPKRLTVLAAMCLLLLIFPQPVTALAAQYSDSTSASVSADSHQGMGSGTDENEGSGSVIHGRSGIHGGNGGSGKHGNDLSKEETDENSNNGSGGGSSEDRKGGINRHSGHEATGNGGKDDSRKDTGGTVTLTVTVKGIDQEVYITLFLSDEESGTLTEIATLATKDGEASFYAEPSGDYLLKGEAVPGYTVPEKDIMLTGSTKIFSEELVYEYLGSIAVEGVSLSEEKLFLLGTETADISAMINPPNALNQEVVWSSADETVAVADGNGLNAKVTAVMPGTTSIEVKTAEGGFSDTCTVTVPEITSIHSLEPYNAVRGEIVSLPKQVTVDLAFSDLEVISDVPVSWIGCDNYTFQVPDDGSVAGQYVLQGKVAGTAETAVLIINVDTDALPAVPVQSVGLNVKTLSLFTGGTYFLQASVFPADATNQDLIWTSDNTSVASVDSNGTVTAVSPGTAVISVTTVDGGHTAYCLVSVAPAIEPALIYACGSDGLPAEGFQDKADVYINVTNLLIVDKTHFFVKVEEKSNDPLLGSGEIDIDDEITAEIDGSKLKIIGEGDKKQVIFNLDAVTNFELSDRFSSAYYVFMSTDSRYPLDDEKTLRTNFKIGSATPTIPDCNVTVTAEVIGGPLHGNPEGLIFILARELGKNPSETMWYDYLWMDQILESMGLDSSSPALEESIKQEIIKDPYNIRYLGHLYFSDEAKRTGKYVAEDGKVVWDEGKETLKMGGYLLLEVTPPGYVDNLNSINPDSEDGSLLKEVHLERDGVVQRHVINLYVGGE